jgi:hypothetical protein
MKVKHVAKEVGSAFIIRDAEGNLVAIYCGDIKVLMMDNLELEVDTLDAAMELVGELA